MSHRTTKSVTAPIIRAFSSSSSSSAGQSGAPSDAIQAARRKGDRPIASKHVQTLRPFEFNDIPTAGYNRLFQMKEALELGEKVQDHEAVLRAHRRPFVPPKSPVRLGRIIDLCDAKRPTNKKCSLLVPVAVLALNDKDAIQRCKLIAGTRWTPGKPGKKEAEYSRFVKGWKDPTEIGREGWIYMSEGRFEEGRMNRKSLSDILDRLVDQANDTNSPVDASTPLDLRHVIARGASGLTHQQAEAYQRRMQANSAGNVKTAGGKTYSMKGGFPAEWLSKEVKKKAQEGRERGLVAS